MPTQINQEGKYATPLIEKKMLSTTCLERTCQTFRGLFKICSLSLISELKATWRRPPFCFS